MRKFSMLMASLLVSAMPTTVSAQSLIVDTTGLDDPFGFTGYSTAVVQFYTSQPGDYTFGQTAGFLTFLSIYEGSIDPSNPDANNLAFDFDDGSGALIENLPILANIQYFVLLSSVVSGDAGLTTLTVSGPADVTFDALPAVPEPASWALMIGGFALAGGALRRRATTVSFA